MKKQIIKIAIGLLLAGNITAQDLDQRRSEISIYAAAGLSTLQYDLNAGKHKNGFGGQAGLGYTFFFSPRWGFVTGAEIALYQAKSTLSGFSDSYEVQGAIAADNYTYTYMLNNYSEALQVLYINIPLMLQFQTCGKHKFFAALGGKIGFPVKATAKTNDYSLSTQGYFPAEGRTYDDLPQFGFGTYNYAGSKTDLDKLNLNLMASAEMGVKWKIGNKNAFYTGIYADYGFNNIQKTNDKTFVQSTLTGVNPPMSPLIESQYAGKPFTDKITPLAVGLKIKFAFGCGKNFQKPAEVEKTVEQNVISEEIAIIEEIVTVKKEAPVLPPPAPVEVEIVKEKVVEVVKVKEAEVKETKIVKKEVVVNNFAKEESSARRQVAINVIQEPIESYALGKTELSTYQKQELDIKIVLLQQYPDMNVFIYGHTCNLDSNVANEKVGLQRAEKVKEYMLSKGIAASRILGTASKGDTEPLVQNTNEKNRKHNRRVEVIVQ